MGEPDEAFDEGSAELSASSRTFVALRQDTRRCVAPLCGGYWVHDLNRATLSETYVSGLDFGSSTLSDDDQQRVYEAVSEVVLRGKLGPKEPRFGTRAFIVSEAYRGLPGQVPTSADRFFKVSRVDIQCIRAPCPALSAKQVNHTPRTLFHDLWFDVPAFVDVSWLTKRTVEDQAIAMGSLVRQGDALTLQARNVYLRLPERMGPCPASPIPLCGGAKVNTFARTADRCVVADQCVTPGLCPLYLPACGDGYTLQSWAKAPFACPAYACDPSWLF